VPTGTRWPAAHVACKPYDHDRRTLHAAILQRRCYDLSWALIVPKLDPLLWIPDAVAWAWARGGLWRQRVAQFCEERGL
jgi:hypothetical protein